MKVIVIGAGNVGSAVIGEMLAQGSISEIVLINRTQDKAEGEVLDYSHTISYNYHPSADLKVGDYSDCAGADIIIMTAGAAASAGETRRDLAETNTAITQKIMKKIMQYTTDAFLIPVSNPVDLNAYVAVKAGYDRKKVIGTGTIVDSARFMSLVAKKYDLDPKNIFGYLLGEHGRSSFVAWSIAGICGYDFDTFAQIRGLEESLDKEKIEKEVKKMGHTIWKKKGYTNHGIAGGVSRIVKAITLSEQAVMPVSVYLKGEYNITDVSLSVPCIIGSAGIEKILEFPLNELEQKKLANSAQVLKEMIDKAIDN